MKDTLARAAADVTRVDDAGRPAVSSDFSYPPIEQPRASFEPAAMQRFLDGEHRAVRELVKEIITQPEFRYFEARPPCLSEASAGLDKAPRRCWHRTSIHAEIRWR